MTRSPPSDVSEPQWGTPYLKCALQFLALPAPERRAYLPYTFGGRVTLDNGYQVECDDPMHLMLFFLRDFTALPEFWEQDPEFTALALSSGEHVANAVMVIADLGVQLEALEWPDLQTNARECQNLAAAVLALLAWPCTAPGVPAADLLDGYTYGGFSEVARAIC